MKTVDFCLTYLKVTFTFSLGIWTPDSGESGDWPDWPLKTHESDREKEFEF